MKVLLRILVYSLYICGFIILIILPNNKYQWIQEFDKSISLESLKDDNGNRIIFSLILMIFIVTIQSLLAFKTKNIKEKRLSLILILICVFLWFYKFGY